MREVESLEVFTNYLGITPEYEIHFKITQSFKIAQDNLKMVSNNENVPWKIIKGNESWVFCYEPETKQHSTQW